MARFNKMQVMEAIARTGMVPVFYHSDAEVAKQVYGVDLVPFDAIPKADCVIVAVGHNEFRALSLMQLRELFKSELSNDERVLIDVKSLYRMDELKASGLRFWRL